MIRSVRGSKGRVQWHWVDRMHGAQYADLMMRLYRQVDILMRRGTGAKKIGARMEEWARHWWRQHGCPRWFSPEMARALAIEHVNEKRRKPMPVTVILRKAINGSVRHAPAN